MKYLLIILGFFLLLTGFYWFQIRPARARITCNEMALKAAEFWGTPRYYAVYQGCLHQHGL